MGKDAKGGTCELFHKQGNDTKKNKVDGAAACAVAAVDEGR